MTQKTDDQGKAFLNRLIRKGQASEPTITASAGANSITFPAKVIANTAYNLYEVTAVEITQAGTLPLLTSLTVNAYNIAESFIGSGQLSAGSYVLVTGTGGKYAFYAKP